MYLIDEASVGDFFKKAAEPILRLPLHLVVKIDDHDTHS